MCVNTHGRARLREQIVARKVVDRGGPDEIDATVPRLRQDRLEGGLHGPPTKPWLMPASPVLHAGDGSHGEAGVSPRALRCSIHQRPGLRHGQPARPGCGSSGRTVRIHEPASPESVRCEPRRRADHLAPESPRVRRSRFRHGGYLCRHPHPALRLNAEPQRSPAQIQSTDLDVVLCGQTFTACSWSHFARLSIAVSSHTSGPSFTSRLFRKRTL